MGLIRNLNEKVNESFIGKYFKMKERGTTLTTEFTGGLATFMAMAYVLAANPKIMADSGGTCVPDPEDGGIFGQTYEDCLYELRKQFVTATAIGSMFGCLFMGLFANLPIALAPGMGSNAYFTYSVVGWRGTGAISYEAACTGVLIEGAIFLILALTGARYAIVKLIPEPVKIATPAGIGAFLAHLGLQTAEGIGVVVGDVATAVSLGGCPPEKRTPLVAYDEECELYGNCAISDNYTCSVEGGIMTSATTWIGIFGMMVIAVLMAYKIKLSFVVGIALVTVISWFRNTAVTMFPDTEEGDIQYKYFKKIVDITGVDKITMPFTSDLAGSGMIIFTMLYVDFLDTSGTLLGIASNMGIVDQKTGNFPGSRLAFSMDALATMFGSFFGLCPITSYSESAVGVEAGARTGLHSIFCAFFFFIAIFFAPILASIPSWAIGGALILVGALMAASITKLNFNRVSHAVSGFLTIMIMPLTYSIAYGLLAGIGSYIILEAVFLFLNKVFGIPLPTDKEDITLALNPVEKSAFFENDTIVEPEDVETDEEKPIENDDKTVDDETVNSDDYDTPKHPLELEAQTAGSEMFDSMILEK